MFASASETSCGTLRCRADAPAVAQPTPEPVKPGDKYPVITGTPGEHRRAPRLSVLQPALP